MVEESYCRLLEQAEPQGDVGEAGTEVGIAWKGLKVVQMPTDVPPMFSGSRLVIYGLLHEGQRGTVRLRRFG